MLFSDDVADPL